LLRANRQLEITLRSSNGRVRLDEHRRPTARHRVDAHFDVEGAVDRSAAGISKDPFEWEADDLRARALRHEHERDGDHPQRP
jgi:hypothetical protein